MMRIDANEMQTTVGELQSALQRGPLHMRSMLAARIKQTCVTTRAHYLMAAINVVGAHDTALLKPFFQYLRVNVPPMEQAEHDEAMLIAFRMTHEHIMAMASAHSHELAKIMGLEVDDEMQAVTEAHAAREEAGDFTPSMVHCPLRPPLH